MKLKVKELQAAVNSIQITDKMQEEMIRNIKMQHKKKKKAPRMARVAAAAASVIIISGALSIPVRALVNSIIQERMEKEPVEEMTAIVEDLDSQQVDSDSFSRAYTEEEKSRLHELAGQYQTGTFPSGELFQAQSTEDAENRELYFLVTNSTFYLPDRELTDEELLEIIDFYAKREYAVTKRAEEESADEIAEQKEKKEQQIEAVVDAGGITEEAAIEIAADYLEKIFGITGDGLEQNHYYEGDLTIAGEKEFYQVNWVDFPNRKYYYFYISARDGSLVEVSYSGEDALADKPGPAAAEAGKLIPGLQQKAVSLLEENVNFAYDDIYSVYYTVDDTLCSSVWFKFVQKDAAYAVEYTWEGVFLRFAKSTFSTYEQEYDKVKENIMIVESYNKDLAPGEETEGEVNLFYEKIGP